MSDEVVSSVSSTKTVGATVLMPTDNRSEKSRIKSIATRDVILLRNEMKLYFTLLKRDRGVREGQSPSHQFRSTLKKVITGVLKPFRNMYCEDGVVSVPYLDKIDSCLTIVENLNSMLRAKGGVPRRELLPLLKECLDELKKLQNWIELAPLTDNEQLLRQLEKEVVVGRKQRSRSEVKAPPPAAKAGSTHRSNNGSTSRISRGGGPVSTFDVSAEINFKRSRSLESTSCMSTRGCRSYRPHRPTARTCDSINHDLSVVFDTKNEGIYTTRSIVKNEIITLRNALKTLWRTIYEQPPLPNGLSSVMRSSDLAQIMDVLNWLREEITDSLFLVPVSLRTDAHEELVQTGIEAIYKSYRSLFKMNSIAYSVQVAKQAKTENVYDLQIDLLQEITEMLNSLKYIPVEPELIYHVSLWRKTVRSPRKRTDLDRLTAKLDDLRKELDALKKNC